MSNNLSEIEQITDSRDGDDEKPTGLLREQDRFLPIANVARLMKKSIPKTGKVIFVSKALISATIRRFVM